MNILQHTTRRLGLALACGIVTYAVSAQTVEHERQKLTASDAATIQQFGNSVSVSGDYAIVGAHYDSDRGSAYVFERNSDGVWTQVAKLIPSDCQQSNPPRFGEGVSVSGDCAIVGAPEAREPDNEWGPIWGTAYVFERLGGGWTKVARLIASDAADHDNFGVSVSVSGDYAIVGADSDDDYGDWSGSAYAFERIDGVWTETAKLTASDGAAGDLFGHNVFVSGDRAIVGAYGHDGNGNASGSAYVFERIGGDWTEVAKLTASDGAAGDLFGNSVSVSGDRAIVGARNDRDDNNVGMGSAYVYERVGGVWTQVTKLTPTSPCVLSSFGYSVSISGDRAIVGDATDDDNGFASGSAYVFVRLDGVWMEVAKLTPSDGADQANFGNSVSVSGDRAIVGALCDSEGGYHAGAAYVFEGTIVEKLGSLVADVLFLNLQQGIENALDTKLNSVLSAWEDLNEHNNVAAINSLEAFIKVVEAQSGRHISTEDAAALIAAAQAIIDQLTSE